MSKASQGHPAISSSRLIIITRHPLPVRIKRKMPVLLPVLLPDALFEWLLKCGTGHLLSQRTKLCRESLKSYGTIGFTQPKPKGKCGSRLCNILGQQRPPATVSDKVQRGKGSTKKSASYVVLGLSLEVPKQVDEHIRSRHVQPRLQPAPLNAVLIN